MDLREAKNFDGIEEEVNHWWIRTRFNYINEIIEYYQTISILWNLVAAHVITFTI